MQFSIRTSAGTLRVLQYNVFANRPTIVFLHESLGCIAHWKDFPKKLGDIAQCNVMVYDRLGYGQSDPFVTRKRDMDYLEIEADLLVEVLELCKIEHPIIFGHSDGGSIALIFGAKYPSIPIGIISESAHIFVEEESLAGIKEAVKVYETTDLKSKLEKYHGDKTDDVFWVWADTWLTEQFKEWTIENYLPRITCPVLVIQGDKDEYGTIKQVEGIAGNIVGRCEKLVLPNVGHTPHREEKERVLQVSNAFIQSIFVKNG